jgi:hypothetical protein
MNSATFLMITGLLLTMGGVGGIENSVTDADMGTALLISILGMGVMWCGVRMMQILDNQS